MTTCKACDEPLVLRVDQTESSDDEAGPGESSTHGSSNNSDTVPDDLELPCSCHFHWQCLLEESAQLALTLKCPSCDTYLPANQAGPSTTNTFLPTSRGASILTRYTNEGGVQDDLDILPSVTEEAYFESHPEARPAHALHVMCAEGDVGGIVELLRDVRDEVEDIGAFICYQDPLSSMKSGLHLAVENGQEDVILLLLWLYSHVPTEAFPDSARQVAATLDVERLRVPNSLDIRTLQDSQGQTAEQVAHQLNGQNLAMLGSGLLSP